MRGFSLLPRMTSAAPASRPAAKRKKKKREKLFGLVRIIAIFAHKWKLFYHTPLGNGRRLAGTRLAAGGHGGVAVGVCVTVLIKGEKGMERLEWWKEKEGETTGAQTVPTLSAKAGIWRCRMGGQECTTSSWRLYKQLCHLRVFDSQGCIGKQARGAL